MKSLSVIIGMLFLAFNFVSAQELDDLFDDDNAVKSNFIKINLPSIAIGDLSIHYEHIFGDKIGIELSGGVQLPYYLPDNLMFTTETIGQYMMDNVQGGYSTSAQVKIYSEKFEKNLPFDV